MKIIRIVTSLFLTFCVIFTILFGVNKISEEKQLVEAKTYKGIITLWHIDSFPGGKGSRKQFLIDAGISFEKQNDGVLVMVISHTINSAEESFAKGIIPDLISYSNGLSTSGFLKLEKDFGFNAGKVGDNTFAVPWCRGGYALISNPNYKAKKSEKDIICVSNVDYNLPLICLNDEDVDECEIELLPPDDAYYKFVSGRCRRLLGTQRDIERITNRGMEVQIKPITNFNDLFQYISVCSVDENKKYYSEVFINYLLEEKTQMQLDKIGMFSVFYEVNYQNSMQEMQKIKEIQTISPFTDKQTLLELKDLSLNALKGDEEAVLKIKNIII